MIATEARICFFFLARANEIPCCPQRQLVLMYPVMQWASVLRERAGQVQEQHILHALTETRSTADAAPSARRPID